MQDLTNKLAALLNEAAEVVMLPVADVESMLRDLRPLRAGDLREVAIGAGIKFPERAKGELLKRIEGKLNAGRRVMAQTEV